MMAADVRYKKILRSLSERKELIVPWLESAMLSEQWPDKYTVEIDSGPYYGVDSDGKPDGYFHPSTHPLMGARELYLLFNPATRDRVLREKRSLASQMALAMGSSIHGIVQTQFLMAGLCQPEDIEVEYVNEEHHVRGRVDFIVNHPDGNRYAVELKSQNSFGFAKQEEIKPAWDAQLSLGLDNVGIDLGVLLVFEAGYPYRLKEYSVPRNDKLLSEIYGKFDSVREAIELGIPPKPCCPLDSQKMNNCPCRFVCWLSDDPELRP